MLGTKTMEMLQTGYSRDASDDVMTSLLLDGFKQFSHALAKLNYYENFIIEWTTLPRRRMNEKCNFYFLVIAYAEPCKI